MHQSSLRIMCGIYSTSGYRLFPLFIEECQLRCFSCLEILRILNKLIETELHMTALEGLCLSGPFAHEAFGSRLSATLANFVPPGRAADVLIK